MVGGENNLLTLKELGFPGIAVPSCQSGGSGSEGSPLLIIVIG